MTASSFPFCPDFVPTLVNLMVAALVAAAAAFEFQSESEAKPKARYRVINWPEYNRALINRGSLTVWITQEALDAWFYEGPPRHGRKPVYSDLAIQTILTLKVLFQLPLGQTQGLARSIFDLMGIDLPIPDYTTLCRRGKTLKLALPAGASTGPIALVIDSTGLKVYGEGEWKVRQHGYSKRRTWVKLHLGVDPKTHEIKAAVITEAGVSDAQAAGDLMDQAESQEETEVETVIGDKGYDQKQVYAAAAKAEAELVVPPRVTAKVNERAGEDDPRNRTIKEVEEEGTKEWKKRKGYHRRSLGETAMGRIKGIFGPGLRSREWMRQATEVGLRCVILNRMTGLGMPVSVRIA